MKLTFLIAALVIALPAAAQNRLDPHGAPPGVDPNSFKPLGERGDVVPWRILAQVGVVKQNNRYVPQFSQNVTALDNKDVKIQGFMMPLEMGDKQSHFILSSMPQTCPFCMPGGPESLVEVKMKKPLAYGMEPVVITGKLAVLKDDPTGVFYRLTDAVAVK